MIDTVEGIVISETNYGETSKIINVLTKELGIVGMMAKGARTMKSPLRSSAAKLTYARFYIKYNKDKLSNLNSVDILDSFKNIRKDIRKISYVSFLLDLSTQVLKHGISEDLYPILISSIHKIDEGYDPMVITNILELKYLDFLGVMPILDSCSVCGESKGIATLSAHRGGYICNNCLKGEKIVSEKTIKLIRMFYYVDIDKISKLDISEQSKMEINNFLNEYYDRYTGLYLKTKEFINNLEYLK